ncbi:endogenous retrovirus group S71 member 1 Env polyprotein-like [Felis catus]|uniref:endogenous retrovirus group S71 member 1 Env polyprotein-like n=1 Tax=Felis catus TaxID=9685 RepID=UPI001D19E17C|nr:endogenous retrovirus group S71 member 1 Env polyprotein-like [Felis catus]XP_044903059.1 endogenous retrovirus group S71 member 1 Env polyprotein-like [Felis catus]XP_044903060.1 endogenous retrovirus group S71 member 1 Env polyprotein-like [Felis catus]
MAHSPTTTALMLTSSPARNKPEIRETDTFKALYYTFKFLNATNPNITWNCWLCLNPRPPYYIGIGAPVPLGMREDQVRNLSHGQIEGHCTWGQNPSLTLGDLEGMGTCFYAGNYQIKRSRYLAYCNSTIYLPNNTHVGGTLYFLVPPSGTWFACSLGLTPCLNLHLIIKRSDFCILVHLLPQVFYFSGEGGKEHLGFIPQSRFPREPISPILVPLFVGLGVAGSIGVSTAAFITGDQNFKLLSKQIDQDISELERNIDKLSESVNSLAEVVLQNRRGLDLLFLQQGGLCMALGEQCCFYVNNSGIIKQTLSQVRQ